MNQAIRNSWIVALCLFTLLFGSITYVQFFAADELKDNPWNSRSLYQQFDTDRGAIIAGGQQIAYSKPSDDQFKYQRVYKYPEVFAPLTGFYSLFNATGLESAMNEHLSGQASQLFYDRLVQIFSGDQPKGGSVELTIDPQIQQLAYDLIGDHKGSIVVMDPQTGAIIAMVSKPSYNPNVLADHNTAKAIKAYDRLASDPDNPLYNRAIGGNLYAPGSVFKIIDTTAALESDEYSPDSILPNPNSLQFGGYSLPNYQQGGCAARQEATFAFALAQSCNTPFASIALNLGQDTIREEAQEFGFGHELNIPLHVTPSVFPETHSDAALAQAAIGQRNVRVTPLQIAMMTSVIANDGELMKPTLIKTLRAPDLQVLQEFEPEKLRTVTTPEIANQITEWMVGVVDNGIGAGAAVPGVEVAGKTGTAELGVAGQNNSWFTGFAPADDPQVAISIVIEDVDVATGAALTSPNAKKIFEAVLNK